MKALALALLALLSLSASGMTVVAFNQKDYDKSIASGGPVALRYFAEWCIICQQQKFMINELKKDEKFSKFTVYQVDFDFEKEMKTKYKVERQSTIIVLRDGVEISRELGIKDKEKIGALLKQGL